MSACTPSPERIFKGFAPAAGPFALWRSVEVCKAERLWGVRDFWRVSLEWALSDTARSGDAHGHIPVAVGSKRGWLAVGLAATCPAGWVTGCLAGLLFTSQMRETDGRSFKFHRQVRTLFDFGMSWLHLSAFGILFANNKFSFSWWIPFNRCWMSLHNSNSNRR